MSTEFNHSCHQSLSQLMTRLQASLEKNPVEDANWLQQRQSLSLANALLRNHASAASSGPQHIVVVGPTQVGKSTVINHLTGSEVAGVSALAGYTRHAQGFSNNNEIDAALYQELFPNWDLVQQAKLDPENTRQFSIQAIQESSKNRPQHIVYWDTPDFDSVSSRSYRTIVPNLSAIASVLVLVLSKEKYADNSVWEFLKMLAPLQLPLVICLNKAEAQNLAVVSKEIEERLSSINCQHHSIVALPWQQNTENTLVDEVTALREAVANALASSDKKPKLKTFFENNWARWIAPAIAEQQAYTDWNAALDEESQQLLAYYQKNYLQQTRYSEALQRAISKLLELLEIPVLAGTLGTLRKVITWPVRTLGKTVIDSVSDVRNKAQTNESIILNEAYQNALVNLVSKAQHPDTNSHPQQQIWWNALRIGLDQQRNELQSRAESRIEKLQDSFEPEIEAAANRLYEQLQDQPATLNSLRAARVTTDAAALALAVHTGGLSATDLVLAPALLSVTSLLTESAVGQHMKVIEKELKEKQYAQVKNVLVANDLREPMLQLGQNLSAGELYQITEKELQTAQDCLEELS